MSYCPLATSKGVLTTMENPSNSYFWLTCWVKVLQSQIETFQTDFQVCMYGGSRDKWTKILSNFQLIQGMDIKRNRQHEHAAWGVAFDEEGKQVRATSLESALLSMRKMCVVLTSLSLQAATRQNLTMRASDLIDVQSNPLQTSLHSQVGAHGQPKPSKMPPLVPNFSSVATFLCEETAVLRDALQSKLSSELQLHTKAGRLKTFPNMLACYAFLYLILTICEEVLSPTKKPKIMDGVASIDARNFPYQVAFGMPWEWHGFVQRACNSEHPFLQDAGVPNELDEAIKTHIDWTDQQLCKYRMDRCKR